MGCKTSKQAFAVAVNVPQQGRNTTQQQMTMKKITDGPVFTRSTIWYAGEPEMEPVDSGISEMLEMNDFQVEHEPDSEQDSVTDFEIRKAVSAVVEGAVGVGAMEGSCWLPVLPVSPTPSAASSRSAISSCLHTDNEDEPDHEFAHLAHQVENEPDSEQDDVVMVTNCSAIASFTTPKDLDAMRESEIRQAVLATVSHAFAVAAMEVALRSSITATLPVAAAQSATMLSTSGTVLAAETNTGRCPPEAVAVRPCQRRSKVPALNLKMLAWCCK